MYWVKTHQDYQDCCKSSRFRIASSSSRLFPSGVLRLPFRPRPKENFTEMVGAIGSGISPRPNRRLVGDSPRLPTKALPKIGRTITLSWPGVANASLTRPSPAAVVISMGGVEIEVALREWPMPTVRGRQRGIRWRMICPQCASVRDALHFVDGVWCCRGASCGNLSFACRHQRRYCTAIGRRERLRRKLIRTPPRSLKARVLRKMIAREERAMLAHLERVSGDLTKRSERDARRRRANPERA